MPSENPWAWFILLYCLAPLVALGIVGWVLVNIYRAIFGGVKSVVDSAASVPRQAIRTYGRVVVAKTAANAVLEVKRLESPEKHEKLVRNRVWAAYALVGLIGGPILLVATVILYLFGFVGGIALTAADFVGFLGYVAYGFHLMDEARKGNNPKSIEQGDAKRVAAGQQRPVTKTK